MFGLPAFPWIWRRQKEAVRKSVRVFIGLIVSFGFSALNPSRLIVFFPSIKNQVSVQLRA